MGDCPINKCGKPIEYFLSFILHDKEGNMKGKSLWGCLCADHAYQQRDEYEKMGRRVELIYEKEAREKARKEREEEIKNWGKGRTEEIKKDIERLEDADQYR